MKSIPILLLLLLFSCYGVGADPDRSDAPPNIIFIMADDLGYGDLGCFGGEKILTPNVDQLALEGTRFTQFYSGSPVCAPARGVLMTGLHSGHARIRNNSPKKGGELEQFGEGSRRLSLIGNEPTVASVLKQAGYDTGISGKWGIGEPTSNATPTQMGFDEWLGYLNQNHAPYYYTDFLWRNLEKMPIPENQNGKREIYSNDLMRDFALDFIRSHKEDPFFLYLPLTIPHSLMEVPYLGVYTEKDWPEDVKIYAAMVSRLDSYVGEIVEELEQWNLTKNTLVFFTSDNGAVGNDRTTFLDSAAGQRGSKGTVYEGGLRVPLVMKWPGVIEAGESNDTPWMFVDVLPTLAKLSNAPLPGNLDGVSLLPTILGEKQDELSERFLYWEYPKRRLWQAGRLGKWKAVRYGMDGQLELYDLETDPQEKVDVSSQYPKLVEKFEIRLTAEHTPSPHWPVH
ncbi:arylsulfatase [Opitutia bacterium ISCC 51]|nr:arylsulfatase [Opitutae bacterium ISCC 51]QXD29772.1 arylsulfatase [Opitutae bacterium ISCC 52]